MQSIAYFDYFLPYPINLEFESSFILTHTKVYILNSALQNCMKEAKSLFESVTPINCFKNGFWNFKARDEPNAIFSLLH